MKVMNTLVFCSTIVCCSLLVSDVAFSQETDFPADPSGEETTQIESETIEAEQDDVLARRVQGELFALNNNFIIQQHHTNYVLPITVVDEMNVVPFLGTRDRELQDHEAKFQVSIKMPLYTRTDNPLEGLYVAYTAKSFWQIYNSDISRPFRETNYEPEIFYRWAPNWSWGDLDIIAVSAGFNHQSNGQINAFSRSWNRVTGSVAMQYDRYFALLTVWHRISEDPKSSPDDPNGDDNPDITDYLGNFELTVGTRVEDLELSLLVRNNLRSSENRGFYEATIAYPLNERFDVMFQASKGYGDSLIDYNEDITRYSLGFRLAAF